MNDTKFQKQMQQLVSLFQCNRLPEARVLGMRLRRTWPRQLQVVSVLGAIHGSLGEFALAEGCYRTLVAHEPQSSLHHYYLALALVMQRRLNEALPHLVEVLRLKPDFAEAWMQMGCLLRDLGQHEQAIAHFRHALELSPQLADAAVFLGNLYIFQGRLEDALTCHEQALIHRPDHPDAIAGKALILERQGDQKTAWDLLQTAVAQGRVTPNVAIALALLAHGFAATDQAKTLLQGLLTRGGLAPTQRQELNFALGKLCDKVGDYDAAFEQYAAGNRLAQISFDMAALRAKAERIKQVFSRPDVFSADDSTPDAAPVPIFIVGMPRSGTSLVEQILASHPDVAAGGELNVLPELERMSAEILGRSEPYPECLIGASSAELTRLSERYRAAITEISPGARYVTDKLPPNYERLGLIQRLFPKARIIHTQRDPRDTCLSCFFQNFGNTHTYSTSLGSLGKVYGLYRELMKHWHMTLSMSILDVTYETLVVEPEMSVRRLLEFCGLTWHDDCLNFHNSKRYVNTASYDQVRQPLYDSSVGRWRHYENHLEKLLEALPSEVT